MHYTWGVSNTKVNAKTQKTPHENADGLSHLPITLAQEEEDVLDTTRVHDISV